MSPTQLDKLIKSKTSERSSQPKHKEDHRQRHRNTKKQNQSKSRNSQNICIFSQEKHCKTYTRIFCHKTSYKFRFCFWQIKWSSISFSYSRDHKQYSHRKQWIKETNIRLSRKNIKQIYSTQSEQNSQYNQRQTY